LDAKSTSDPDLKGKLQLPIYVINGFCGSMKTTYESPVTVISYMVLEWNSSQLSWADMLVDVIGDRVPSLAKQSSIRGSAHHDWQALKLHAQPNGKDNCLHVSSSSFEALAEKYIWLNSKSRTVVLQTDVLASQYLAAQIPHHTLTKWFTNPVINEVHVFDLMYGFGVEQCIEKSSFLTGTHTVIFSCISLLNNCFFPTVFLGVPAKKKQKLIERLNERAKRTAAESPLNTQRSDFSTARSPLPSSSLPAFRPDKLYEDKAGHDPMSPIDHSVRVLQFSPEATQEFHVRPIASNYFDDDDDDDDDFDPFDEIRKSANETRPNTSASTFASLTTNTARSDTSTTTAFRGGRETPLFSNPFSSDYNCAFLS
jgi:hypothetical protein